MATTLFINGEYISDLDQIKEILNEINSWERHEKSIKQLVAAARDGVLRKWASKLVVDANQKEEEKEWKAITRQKLEEEEFDKENKEWDSLNKLREVFGLERIPEPAKLYLEVKEFPEVKYLNEQLARTDNDGIIPINIGLKPTRQSTEKVPLSLFDERIEVDMNIMSMQRFVLQPSKGQIVDAKGKISLISENGAILKSQECQVEEKARFVVGDVSFDMVFVKGGYFKMGAISEHFDREKPVHRVLLGDYYIGETVVTQDLWKVVMGNNPSQSSRDNNCPVESVSWNDAQEFIKELNGRTKDIRKSGTAFRLPTEAEWEFAARGGNKSNGYMYSGSNEIDKVAWYGGNSNGETHPVKGKKPNELGLYDMSGNVFEWCQDWYGEYTSALVVAPTGPGHGRQRVCRGGRSGSDAKFCRVSYRNREYPDYRLSYLGFRLVLASSLMQEEKGMVTIRGARKAFS